MGNNAIRRLVKQEQKWRDKSQKHKHRFSIHALVELNHGNQYTTYHDVMRCEKCNSFNCISRAGAVTGIITDESLIDRSKPIIKLYTPHKWIIGWNDVVEYT